MSVDIRRPARMSPDQAARWDEQVEGIVDWFDYEFCDACGGDLEDHIISPGPLGHAHAWCKRDGDVR
jgi:hypothetical protein